MLNLIGIIASGLFVGVLARFFYPGAVDLGFGMTVLLIYLGRQLGWGF